MALHNPNVATTERALLLMRPSCQTFKIRRATVEMADALSRLAYMSKQHWGYPAEWMDVWRPSLTITPRMILQNEVFTAVASEGPIGFYLLSRHDSEATLDHLWIDPARLRQGLGRALFEHAV